jgi:hypothetical protein
VTNSDFGGIFVSQILRNRVQGTKARVWDVFQLYLVVIHRMSKSNLERGVN